MKTLIAIVLSSCLMLVTGCESSRGGSVGTGEGFKIVSPPFDTTIKQGDTASVAISLDRGDSFKRNVTLHIQASTGISVEPTEALIKGSDKPELTLRITAGKDANIGTYQVFVKATPQTGESTSAQIKVNVVSP